MLPQWYTDYKQCINSQIGEFLDEYFSALGHIGKPSSDFCEMVKYAAQGGKRFRAILGLEFYLIFTGKRFEDIEKNSDILRIIIAIELLHSYSLVHDDLPCMDNDEYRRGQLTVWKKYGEYQAVLVGDTLNTLCFEILSGVKDAHISQKLVQLISSSVGVGGMIGGQVDDMYYEQHTGEISKEILEKLHNKKTGKLIEASVLAGLIVADKNIDIQQFADFGKMLGLAFQIKDDILDIEGNFEETGKSVGGETKGFVHIFGLEESKKYLERLIEKCRAVIQDLHSEKLDFMVDFVAHRHQ